MDIYSIIKNYQKDIVVEGEFRSKQDVEDFLKEIRSDDLNKSISFVDTHMLPCSVVEVLWSLKATRQCTINVFEKNLYFYLSSLGINCSFMEGTIKHGGVELNYGKKGTNSRAIDFQEQELEGFLYKIKEKYGYDYTQYSTSSLCRRMKITMGRLSIENLQQFEKKILEDANVFKEFFLDMSINTTDFFRNPEVFSFIREQLLPYLNKYQHIKIWCVGCSTGKEPYSLAILLEELGMMEKVQIYATDINPYTIEEAKNGIYSMISGQHDRMNYKMAGGNKFFYSYFDTNNQYMKIKDNMKKKILFFPHNVVNGGFTGEFQLILCRNLFIYFKEALQKKVLEYFYDSLDRDGFLVLGKTEEILQGKEQHYFEKYHYKNKIYKKL